MIGDKLGRRAYLVRVVFLLAMAGAAGGWLCTMPPIKQKVSYHDFADQRPLLGVPHFGNVLSNAPFLGLGLVGLWSVWRAEVGGLDAPFATSAERWPFVFFFLGVGATAFGSAYYHLEPTNERLVWDRLPMAIVFMALVSSILIDRLGRRVGLTLLLPLLAAGVASVFYWRATDDLRPYYFVQFFPLAAIPFLLVFFPPRYTAEGYLWLALVWYVAAKFCEHPLDRSIFQALGHTVSGHTLKHLLAAVGIYCILRMMVARRPVENLFG